MRNQPARTHQSESGYFDGGTFQLLLESTYGLGFDLIVGHLSLPLVENGVPAANLLYCPVHLLQSLLVEDYSPYSHHDLHHRCVIE